MKRYCIIAVIACLFTAKNYAQTKLITNTLNRESISLNGHWKYIIDPYEGGFYNYRLAPLDQQEGNEFYKGFYADKKQENKSDLIEYNFDKSDELIVPGDWNHQDDKLLYYEGTVWYRKRIDNLKKDENKRYFLYFGGANYQTDVYLNAKKLGQHIGGFTPFNFEITDNLEDNNSLVVKVDNKRKREAVPTVNTDWWNYGGLTRDVRIIETPATFIRDYTIQLNPDDRDQIMGYVQLDGDDFQHLVKISIPELKIEKELKPDQNGYAEFLIKKVKNIDYWHPDNPKLYTVELSYNEDVIDDKIGFRTIKVNGNKILVNGEPIFLRGICIHEENPFKGGRTTGEAGALILLNWVKEMNGNYARLAHYPHNEYMAKLADEMGIMLWEEIPVYWTIDWNNQETLENAKNQLTELIVRDKNRASVIIWSMANETPVKPERTDFLKQLSETARELDNTRLISAAMETHDSETNPNMKIVNDPASEFFDIVSFNQYNGWYNGLPNEIFNKEFDIQHNKPVVISEFGGGALAGFTGDPLERWTEDFQAYLYEESFKMLEKIDNLSGLTPWLLVDFRSPRRPLAGIQDGYNRKGLISETGQKKRAFYVVKEYYKKLIELEKSNRKK